MKELSSYIQEGSVPKFQQLIDYFLDAISNGQLSQGDVLPSVNHIYSETGLARGTIVKALDELKKRGMIESVPNKGYFVAREKPRVMLLLDTMRPFKQVIYEGLRQNLSDQVEVNMFFHHYNIRLMEEIINSSLGKYSSYIIMTFNHPHIPKLLKKMDPKKLLVFDWWSDKWGDYSYLAQDFSGSVSKNLVKIRKELGHYNALDFICPDYANHPPETKKAFLQFCRENGFKGTVSYDITGDIKGKIFLVVDDQHLIQIVKTAREKGYKVGHDVGLISFNDYPMKEVLEGGITVISPNYYDFAKTMADYVKNSDGIRNLVVPNLILRSSI